MDKGKVSIMKEIWDEGVQGIAINRIVLSGIPCPTTYSKTTTYL